MRIGVDTGGTFTDFVFLDGKSIHLAKIPSTPRDPGEAITAGLDAHRPAAAPGRPDSGAVLVHGTTVATNALLQRRLARVTFVTNRGLEDVLEIGRQARPRLYALAPEKPAPLVPRARRIGLDERRDAAGREVVRPSDDDLDALAERVARTKPDVIAVGLLHSYLDGRSERRVGRRLKRLGVPVVLSSDVAPEVREFERSSTTVANAALLPGVAAYLDRLAAALRRRGRTKLFVFQSNGGMAHAAGAARNPVRLVLSGPAGGAVAAAAIARAAKLGPTMTLDMGGTSTDVALLDGAPTRRGEVEFDGLPLLVPSLDIRSVGAGGGSIATVDGAGLLRVGPRSAGSDPGPACYGRSDLPTVTDAHLVLGRLPETLAGGLALDRGRAHAALSKLGRALGLDAEDAAEGVLDVADATMARATRVVAVERGKDPRRLALLAFGGAGPLHAGRLLKLLPAREAVVPRLPGHLSAYGMALADAERDLARTVLIAAPDDARDAIDRALDALVEAGARELVADGLLGADRAGLEVTRTVDCRYEGQTATLEVPATARSLRRAFDREHEARFGHSFEERPVVAVNVRVRLRAGSGAGRFRPKARRTPPARSAPARARLGRRPVRFAGRPVETPVFARDRLRPGDRLAGPAIVEEFGSTTVVEPGLTLTVDGPGNLRLA
ncbi:MAG: hydantoinase/oxoprolinase family protein [Planctomycetota bacterium JB042]